MKDLEIPPTRLGTFLWANKIPPTELARAIGVNQSYFSQLIWGTRSSEEVCLKVAKELEIPLELIYEGPLKRGRPVKSKTE